MLRELRVLQIPQVIFGWSRVHRNLDRKCDRKCDRNALSLSKPSHRRFESAQLMYPLPGPTVECVAW